jgi:hypothetical protein
VTETVIDSVPHAGHDRLPLLMLLLLLLLGVAAAAAAVGSSEVPCLVLRPLLAHHAGE